MAGQRSNERLGKVLSLILITAFLSTLVYYNVALSHGMDKIASRPFTDVVYNIVNSPVDQSNIVLDKFLHVENSLDNTYIVFYRPDCEECHISFNEYKESFAFKNNGITESGKKVLFVSTRSESGRVLKNDFGIEEVPTVLMFDESGRITEVEDVKDIV